MKSTYVQCACHSDEHVIRFSYDQEDNEIYSSVYLHQYRGIFHRIWVAIKYVCGYTSRYGHWDNTIIDAEGARLLQPMINDCIKADDIMKGKEPVERNLFSTGPCMSNDNRWDVESFIKQQSNK